MTVDYLIIGQGICGTMLSWFLHKEGKSFIVVDDDKEGSSSKVAAGIINPVTGRRYVTTWLAEEVLPFAFETYREIGENLQSQFLFERSGIDFFTSPQMLNAFVERIKEDNNQYLHSFPDQNHFNQYFNYEFGCGEIKPAANVNLHLLIASWRKKLLDMQAIRIDSFDEKDMQLRDDGVQWGDVTAQKVIFCDGVASTQNKWFQLLPFAPNKGEALIIEAEDLTNQYLFKRGQMLVPFPVQNTYWVGANYQWDFTDTNPTEAFYEQTTTLLKNWLKVPFKVLFHKASVRPATVERRPFVGFHPLYPQVGILNGMGSKGTSLAPFFAHQMVQHLANNKPITPEANVQRFSRILSK